MQRVDNWLAVDKLCVLLSLLVVAHSERVFILLFRQMQASRVQMENLNNFFCLRTTGLFNNKLYLDVNRTVLSKFCSSTADTS